MKRILLSIALIALAVALGAPAHAQGKSGKPNILIIWGDDIGWFNVSAYNDGMMGYRTPNIDRIANEGMRFTDAYGENSCTAGRAAFITGQSPFRTGLLKVGLPGAKEGMSDKDPTIATLLRNEGYMTGQFGKNHLGDRDEQLPTNHGFDEFFGNLYHLNAEQEPEHPDYPKDPKFKEKFGPRGVIHSYADGRITDTGPLTKKRMETVDGEFLEAALGFMEQSKKADKPFFLWFNTTRMHVWTHLKPESQGVTGQGIYADGMTEHDGHVGQLLDKLDKLGIADNTIVMYSTDNGAEAMTWPDGGTMPFKGEKNTTWEGGFRIPMAVRWPGQDRAEPDLQRDHLAAGLDADPRRGGRQPERQGRAAEREEDRRQELQGPSRRLQLPAAFHRQGEERARVKEMFYFTDDGSVSALRYNDWKLNFSVQNAHGADVWAQPFTTLRMPLMQNLRMIRSSSTSCRKNM